jgi:hypothetical protein
MHVRGWWSEVGARSCRWSRTGDHRRDEPGATFGETLENVRRLVGVALDALVDERDCLCQRRLRVRRCHTSRLANVPRKCDGKHSIEI